jgi:hypothetical protein
MDTGVDDKTRRLDEALARFEADLQPFAHTDTVEDHVALSFLPLLRAAQEVEVGLNGAFPALRERFSARLASWAAGSELVAACAAGRRSAPSLARARSGGNPEGAGLTRGIEATILGSGFMRGLRAGLGFAARRLVDLAAGGKECRVLFLHAGDEVERFVKAWRAGTTKLQLTVVESSEAAAAPALRAAEAAKVAACATAVPLSALLRGASGLAAGGFDLVVVPSLLPCLSDRGATRLLRALRGLVAQGGTIVLGSLAARNGAQAFLRWTFADRLRMRGAPALAALAAAAGYGAETLDVASEPMEVRLVATLRP